MAKAAQPTKQNDRAPFGPAQIALFKFIMTHAGCTMEDICTQVFTDKHKNYVWNILGENKKYIEKREIGGDLPHQYYMIMSEFTKVIDLDHWIRSGEFRMKLVQSTLPLQ